MTQAARIGIYGLGTMGSALALNMAEQGFDVAVANREADWLPAFMSEAGDLARRLHPHETLEAFVAGLALPRIILFMIPSGAPMDAMIEAVLPLLSPGDTIIDGGNADFHATRRRNADLSARDIHFVGMGVSGGEAGARHGPSMMVGGSDHSWAQLGPILTAIAARHEGDPCAAHLGPDGAGHFVKTVHNGIEYADMQVIAEIYGLMRYGLVRAPHEIGEAFARWNAGPLRSYLTEITAELLGYRDPVTGHPAIDVIKDAAGQKGTGRWTVIEAVRLGQSASMIDAAVAARSWSSEKQTRVAIEGALGGARSALDLGEDVLERAFLAARILCYAQGFRILKAASEEYGWSLDLARIAEIWRAGCIIRSDLLDDIALAFHQDLEGGQLILAPAMASELERTIPALRRTVAAAVTGGHAAPALSAAIGWFDTMRQGRGTADLIQAQRDFFGHHGFERLGEAGSHHGPWWD
ncbi:6-phosphogluconate dehydrogenase [Roseovarius nanhaiticus]|uniref:6-phosphogluconate dehydrogenase, decarboxylating n=1 Tax=Roseovarius nanhaiticus TaxID=573024 RepID=A0A1N7G0A8_9RHOB|nr:NADP-dependent phosphogluconate dehydrogenase [Roseovarius nanhaiticus]SEK40786.1 6-phosphogluconate dehydrogenase [Roseovarius nanhaiticus]SIS05886.1 6-phosphogluconate dehydrogenase [Roseovarius nanhaiticus]